MHQQEHHTPKYTIEQAHHELNRLAQLINRPGSFSLQSLVSYVQIYVTMQSQSQEFFASFCEHEIIQKVFASEQSNRDTLKILELFNLILANTNHLNSIIYLFSQPALHTFLFERFNTQKESAEAVEYYVQLLKTVIMKMSNGHSSLIKLFCNNRYSSFPMLYQITYLAVNAHQELVKITAQQCVLLLINLLNKKKVGRGYLSQLQMAVFFYELTLSVGSCQKDLQGGLKYLVDLIVALQTNSTSLKMLMNAFVINIIFKKIHRVCDVLEVLRRFSELMLDCEQLPQPLYQKIRLILSRIVCNFCFNRFLNSTYVTVIIKTLKLHSQPPPLIKQDKNIYSALMKYFSNRFQKLLPFIQQFEKKEESQNDFNAIFSGWTTFNGSSQVNAIKESKQKAKGGILSFFTPKPTQLQLYLRAVTMSVGINYSSLKHPMYKLPVTLDFSTAIFFLESLFVTEQLKLGDKRMGGFQCYQVHFNDSRGNIQLNESFCSEVLIMIQKLHQKDTGLHHKEDENTMEFESNFMLRLKEYLCLSLSDHLLLIQHDYSIKQLSLLNRLLRAMKVNEVVQRKTAQKLLWKLEQIQLEINELAFKNHFRSLITYVLSNQYENLLLKNNFKSKQIQSCGTIIKKMFKYEFIRELIDPKPLSLRNAILNKWKQYIKTQSNMQKLTICKMDRTGRMIIVKIDEQIKLIMEIKEGEQKAVCIDLEDDQISQDMSSEQSIRFIRNAENIIFQSKEECTDFKQSLLKIKGFREEFITKWIVQFFDETHNRLCAVVAGKKQWKNIQRSNDYRHSI